MNRIDFQEKIHPKHFIRIVGGNPLQGETKVDFYVAESTVAGAFGPPQVDNRIRFWNFATRDGKAAFSLFAKPGRKTIGLVACGKFSMAYLWTSHQLCEAENFC